MVHEYSCHIIEQMEDLKELKRFVYLVAANFFFYFQFSTENKLCNKHVLKTHEN